MNYHYQGLKSVLRDYNLSLRDKLRKQYIKNYVIKRDGLLCIYCDKVLSLDNYTMEHIVPDSYGGTFNSTNLTVACAECNNKRGNKSFFKYCQKFNFSQEKTKKFRKLYFANLKIKVLNIAKEEYGKHKKQAVPSVIIRRACQKLKIKTINFSDYEKRYTFDIKFSELSETIRIKRCFEQLIRIIEEETNEYSTY